MAYQIIGIGKFWCLLFGSSGRNWHIANCENHSILHCLHMLCVDSLEMELYPCIGCGLIFFFWEGNGSVSKRPMPLQLGLDEGRTN